jgi:hypothetical protein
MKAKIIYNLSAKIRRQQLQKRLEESKYYVLYFDMVYKRYVVYKVLHF